MYEVWGRGGRVGHPYADKSLADKAFRRQEAPAVLVLGASLLAVRDGTTPNQRAAIEVAVALAHAGDEKIAVPTPDPARAEAHRTPLVTAAATAARRRPIETDDEDETDEDEPCARDDADEADDSDDELPTADAPRTTDDTAVEQPAAAPAPTAQEVPMAPKENCAVKDCAEAPLPVTDKTPKGVEGCCGIHRKAGAWAIKCGRTTPRKVVQYLNEGPHLKGGATIAKTRRSSTHGTKRRPPRSTPANSLLAVEGADGTITVTIALPDDVARAHRCALAVGLHALEALAALRSNSTIAEINAAVSMLPERD